jgi:uncharacterized membrane protein YedE/YeeE
MATEFTPFASFFGGALIGLSAVLLMAFAGRIAGISGMMAGLFPPYNDNDLAGRLAFVLGLIIAPSVALLINGQWPTQTITASTAQLIIAGLLVGFGSVWGSGCTSGHGICGLSRFSLRSLVATLTFMSTAIITVYLMRHVLWG